MGLDKMNKDEAFSDDRRTLLKTASALGAGVLAASGLSGVAQAEMHHHGHHKVNKANQALAAALHACVSASEQCINHCQDMFKKGDTSLAECAISVQETMAFCAAHAKLANYDSKFLKEMSILGIKICEDCQKHCEKHAKKHVECKTCADSCAECVKACKAISA